MTTESLSPASRIVIETFSRPPGERSTSISLIGGVEDAEPAASVVVRGATSAPAAFVAEASGSNGAPTPKGAESCAPNRLVCVGDGAADGVGSGRRPSVALAFDPAGAAGEAEPETRAAGGGAEPSGLVALCAAARERLPRFDDEGAPLGEAIGAEAIAFAMGGTAPAKDLAGAAMAGEKSAAEAPAGANGASTASARLAVAPRWKARSPISRPTLAALAPAAIDPPLSSDFVTAAEGAEGELSVACGRSSIIEAARKANGNDAKSALSFGSEW
jgi:hypothetical protein